MFLRVAVALALCVSGAAAAIPDEDWGYVTVRPGAEMFWWLYGCTSGQPREQVPLIMWLQGGPGGSSTGYGNFLEMGPLDTNLQPRNTTWVSAANVIYVDNPVGTGYSYVDDLSLLTTDNDQIAADLVTFFAAFLQQYPVFQTTPFFIFTESYGGKMTSGFALALIEALANGKIKVDFRGVALGDSWISPIDYVDTWGPFLQASSQIDSNQAAQLLSTVQQCDAAVAAGQWAQATNLWGNVEDAIEQYSDNVDFYNILYHNVPDDEATVAMSDAALEMRPDGVDARALRRLFARHVGRRAGEDLNTLMNGPIRKKLGIIPQNVTWGGQSDAVFSALSGDFMKPVWDNVDLLLSEGRINVTVYNGQLDLICATVGTDRWMSRLKWPGMPSFYSSAKTPIYAPTNLDQNTDAFVKQFSTLSMFLVQRAGHMVPADNGPGALAMVNWILNSPPV